MIYGVSIVGDEARIVLVSGDKNNYQAESCKTRLALPKGDESVKAILELKKNFVMLLQNDKPEFVVISEGGHDSKKKRVRMEFAILCACFQNSVRCETYAASAVSKLIKSGFSNTTGLDFKTEYKKIGLLKKDTSSFTVAWRHLG